MDERKIKEPQYQPYVALREHSGLTQLGLRANVNWDVDPRRLLFALSRYKFIGKMLAGKTNVLEVGCGDGFATRLVLQEVGSVCAVDFDSVFIEDIHNRMDEQWKFDAFVHDMLVGPVAGSFDAAYALDVIEHIPLDDEANFMKNVCSSLELPGVLILGTPSIESQVYASSDSKAGHVNCKSHDQLRELMLRYFKNAFLFSMNDEVVHTGFYPMAHYLIALGVGKRD